MHIIVGKTVCMQCCFYTIIKTTHKLCEHLDNYQQVKILNGYRIITERVGFGMIFLSFVDFHYDTHSILIQCIPFVPQKISLNPTFV